MDEPVSGDMVAEEIEKVRARLAAMRSRGEIPDFPADELARQFHGVVESVEAGLLAAAPVDVEAVRRHAQFPPPPPGGARARLAGAVLRRVGGRLLRPLNAYAAADVAVLEALVDRQQRLGELVLHVQLERIRQLEFRVAQLELELERSNGGGPAPGADA